MFGVVFGPPRIIKQETMKIYTGQTTGPTLERIIELGMGIMISSSPTSYPHSDLKRTFCALDNGAFSCYRKGYPFMKEVFMKTLSEAYKKNITLDFIVTPDIIAGGEKSLSFSNTWANNQLATAPRLALVVQDGMKYTGLGSLGRYEYIFVGGTKEWKWKTAAKWAQVARDYGKKIHIGQCGRLEYLLRAWEIQVDSVDSTSFAVNKSFDIVEEFYIQTGQKQSIQLQLFT